MTKTSELINQLTEFIQELRRIDTVEQYDVCIKRWLEELSSCTLLKEYYEEICKVSRYPKNKLTPENNKIEMLLHRDNLICCIKRAITGGEKSIYIDEKTAVWLVNQVCNNFYAFYKTMFQEAPHRKAGLSEKNLSQIQIQNEYDVQKMLHAILKPIFPSIRTEVNDDTGHHTIRTDLFIPEFNIVIEVKCTRNSLSKRNLSEEIGSDITHYNNKHIVFMIYDKSMIIDNAISFKNTYESKSNEKKAIYVTIVQPIIL